MNAANLLKWIIDLETTSTPQIQNYLEVNDGNCCLGRLCRVAIADGVGIPVVSDGQGGVHFDGNLTDPPDAVYGWLGISTWHNDNDLSVEDVDGITHAPITANDEMNWTFAQIAAGLRLRYADEISLYNQTKEPK